MHLLERLHLQPQPRGISAEPQSSGVEKREPEVLQSSRPSGRSRLSRRDKAAPPPQEAIDIMNKYHANLKSEVSCLLFEACVWLQSNHIKVLAVPPSP